MKKNHDVLNMITKVMHDMYNNSTFYVPPIHFGWIDVDKVKGGYEIGFCASGVFGDQYRMVKITKASERQIHEAIFETANLFHNEFMKSYAENT